MAKAKAAAKVSKKEAEELKKKQAAQASSSEEESSSSEEESSDDEEPAKPAAKADSSSEEESSEEESSDDEEPAKPATNGAAAKKAASSSEEESSEEESSEEEKEEEAEGSSSEEESSSDEEEEPAKPAAKAAAKKADSSSEEESSEEESSDEEDEKPAAKPAAKKEESSSEEESSDEESDEQMKEAEKPKQGTKRAADGKAKKADSSEEEESSDEEEESSEEEEEEEEKKPAAKKQKAADGSAVDVSAASGSRTIFMKNLAWSADEDAIRSFFDGCGEIAEVRVAYDRDTGRARGFAHIQFEEVEGAAKAIQKSGESLLDREVYIESTTERQQRTPGENRFAASEGTTIFVKGFDSSLGEDEVRNQLTEAFGAAGTVVNVRLPTDRESGELKGIGFVEFDSAAAKNKAVELDGTEVAGGWIKVDPNPGTPGGGGRGGGRGGRGGRGDFGGRGGRGGRGDFGGRGRGRGGRGDFGGRGGGRGECAEGVGFCRVHKHPLPAWPARVTWRGRRVCRRTPCPPIGVPSSFVGFCWHRALGQRQRARAPVAGPPGASRWLPRVSPHRGVHGGAQAPGIRLPARPHADSIALGSAVGALTLWVLPSKRHPSLIAVSSILSLTTFAMLFQTTALLLYVPTPPWPLLLLCLPGRGGRDGGRGGGRGGRGPKVFIDASGGSGKKTTFDD
ncbi:hypothetical protein ABPG75_000626 [Micractinium tetrahymenae]